MKNDLKNEALAIHEKYHGKIKIDTQMPLKNAYDLSLLYTPWVAQVCLAIKDDPSNAYKYTSKSRVIAVISDGSAVLGLGNIGALASMPVMEGKCALFKKFGGVEAIPLCLDTQNTEEIIDICKKISPSLAGINLEDISAPRCITIERALKEQLDIPVFHDDQHGTSIVVGAALLNIARLLSLKIKDLKVVLSGTGAAGSSIARMLKKLGVKSIYAYNINGIVSNNKYASYDFSLQELIDEQIITPFDTFKTDSLSELLIDADLFIGVSAANILTKEMVNTMRNKIVFALANPNPEISYNDAMEAGTTIYASGRSDFPNQINNVLVFPGLFKGSLDACATKITDNMIMAAVLALSKIIKKEELNNNYIIPNPFDKRVALRIANAVKKQAVLDNVVRK